MEFKINKHPRISLGYPHRPDDLPEEEYVTPVRFKNKWQAKRCAKFIAYMQLLQSSYHLEDTEACDQFLDVVEEVCLAELSKMVPKECLKVQQDIQSLIEWFIDQDL